MHRKKWYWKKHNPKPMGFVLSCSQFCFFLSAYFDFFFDFFCELLVIQNCVIYPPYVCIFNSFFPLSLTSNLNVVWSERCLKWFLIFSIYQGWIYGPAYDLSWRMFHVHVRKRVKLIVLGWNFLQASKRSN